MPHAEPIAHSWWAQRWLAALAATAGDDRRQARGRSYARDGRVLEATVYPGRVEAAVEGSYLVPYRVTIAITPFSDETWERMVDAIAGQAALAAKLLAGELPRELDEVCARVGVSLAPRGPDELDHTCACPAGWGRSEPCKHIAAVHYVVAANLDRDPALLLALRGRPLDDLVAALRARWASDADPLVQDREASGEGDAGASPAEEPAFAPLDAAGYYRESPDLDAFAVSVSAPPVETALLRRLGRPPFCLADEDPTPALTRVYAAVTRRALQAHARSAEGKRRR